MIKFLESLIASGDIVYMLPYVSTKKFPLESYQHINTITNLYMIKQNTIMFDNWHYYAVSPSNTNKYLCDGILTNNNQNILIQYKFRQNKIVSFVELSELYQSYNKHSDIIQIGLKNTELYNKCWLLYNSDINKSTYNNKFWLADYNFINKELNINKKRLLVDAINEYSSNCHTINSNLYDELNVNFDMLKEKKNMSKINHLYHNGYINNIVSEFLISSEKEYLIERLKNTKSFE